MTSMNRGDVWLVELDPAVGSEQNKTRPAVIVSDDSVGILPLKVIVPLTSWDERYANAPWMVHIPNDENNGLDKVSAADTFQVRSVSQIRLDKRLGSITTEQVSEIKKALAAVFDIETTS